MRLIILYSKVLLSIVVILTGFSLNSLIAESIDENIYGIDVSSWQDEIDWPMVYEDGYQFCFAKATEGVGWTDSFFETNMNEGTSAGLFMGAYHFATPSEDDAIIEAEYFVDIAGDYITDGFLRPVLDLEQGSSLGATALSNWVHTWVETVKTLTGITPIIYVNSNYANNYLLPSVSQYPLWIAHWTYDPNAIPDTGIWDDWIFWQYSDQGSVNGISGYVDLNLFNGNLVELQIYVIRDDKVYVDDDAEPSWYDATHVHTIQEGIDNASGGDTVFVYTGTYFENIIVDKPLHLIGENRTSTIIDGGLDGDVLTVAADDVCVMNFSIQHSGDLMYQDKAVRITGNNCSFNDNIVAHSAGALYLSDSENCTIKDNMFYNCTHDIILDQVTNSTITHNHITNCRGVHLDECVYNNICYNQIINTSSGFYVSSSSYNNIIGNDLSNNGNAYYAGFGVLLEESSCFNLIQLNHICNNTEEGIWSYSGSNNNTIKNNYFASNMIGVFFGNEIVDNKVFHNTFIDNIELNARDYGVNMWDNGYPSGGNYWNDYTGTDGDDDGIGDTPYNIIGGGNKDNFPFMNDDAWIQIDLNQSVYDRGFPIRHALDGDWAAAQDFSPSLDVVSSIDIYLRKFGTPEFDLTVELHKDHPQGILLDTATFNTLDVGTSWDWLHVNFADKLVEPGVQYFVVVPPAPYGVTTSFGYEWGYAFGNQYDDGSFWFTRDGGGLWRDLPTMYEFAFRTFGYD